MASVAVSKNLIVNNKTVGLIIDGQPQSFHRMAKYIITAPVDSTITFRNNEGVEISGGKPSGEQAWAAEAGSIISFAHGGEVEKAVVVNRIQDHVHYSVR